MTKAERQDKVNTYCKSLGIPAPNLENVPLPKPRKKRGTYKRKPKDRSHYRECTREERREMVKGKLCAICALRPAQWVDHCHYVGKIREPLCQRCNSGMGFFDDDPARLVAAATYVTKHLEKNRELVVAELKRGRHIPGAEGWV